MVVLEPDGTPASDAVAFARITDGLVKDPGSSRVYAFDVSASGSVRIAIPATDPYLLRNFPKHKVFNVHVTVIDPGSDPGAGARSFAGVNYVLNLGDPGYPLDFAGVQGSVVTLQRLPEGSAASAASVPLPDDGVCHSHSAYETCVWVSHPYDTQGEQVVVAHNIGAAHDIRTEFTVQGTLQIGTSTVTGVDGLFVEDRGARTLSQDISDRYEFNATTAGPNEDAALYVNFARVDERHCSHRFSLCTTTTTFVPDRVLGETPLLPTSETIYHGYAQNPGPTNTDCTVHLQGSYTNSRGVSVSEDWTFGFDFEGSFKVFNLHVTSVKQNTATNDYRSSYEWKVLPDPYFPYHHLFIRHGHVNTASGAGAVCPTNAPHDTWTDSSWIKKDNPVPPMPPIPPTPEEAEPVREPAEEAAREGQRQGDRCAAAPERCGQGG